MNDDACAECGSTTWTVSVVDGDGHRRCLNCATGWTALLRSYQGPHYVMTARGVTDGD